MRSRSKSSDRSRSRSRGRSVDSIALFPLTTRESPNDRSPLERQPTMRNDHMTGTGYQGKKKKPCPTCAKAYWAHVAHENGVYPFDCPKPEYTPTHRHMGPYGRLVTPVGFTHTPATYKQCDSYFDIPVEEQEPLPNAPIPPPREESRPPDSPCSCARGRLPSPRPRRIDPTPT